MRFSRPQRARLLNRKLQIWSMNIAQHTMVIEVHSPAGSELISSSSGSFPRIKTLPAANAADVKIPRTFTQIQKHLNLTVKATYFAESRGYFSYSALIFASISGVRR